ncbi:trafficking protein particle complex subunit 6B isoform X2 [Carettochelys insculpta]|uniref:trafficking protein particle complex subunit 6B isoform X2 n=1 Tax=Carettochelys insculpta TaxID=44489 RepID=UPI003EC0AA40
MTRPEMADEALFLLLHNEMVSALYRAAEQGEGENGRCISKLENMGFRVGQGLIERFTKDTARFKDELDIMKFICKDFWTTVFKKQIDNLRTNHQRQFGFNLPGHRVEDLKVAIIKKKPFKNRLQLESADVVSN